MKLLVCGGAGFIGSNFVRQRVREHGDEVVVLDKLTYAGREENLARPRRRATLRARRDRGPATPSPSAIATASTRSSTSPPRRTSTARSPSPTRSSRRTRCGTFVLLEAARERGAALRAGLHRRGLRLDRGGLVHRGARRSIPRRPTARRRPAPTCSSPSYFHTYGLETVICRGSNNYGPYQYPEKLIPLMVLNALHGDPLPVYGDGMQVRNWLYVEDFGRGDRPRARARRARRGLQRRRPRRVPEHRGRPAASSSSPASDESLIEYVTDRPGHDRRYSLGSEKVRALGWEPQVRFDEGLEQTVAWYRDNAWWWEPIRSGDYREYYERHYGRALGG